MPIAHQNQMAKPLKQTEKKTTDFVFAFLRFCSTSNFNLFASMANAIMLEFVPV